jgi:hypothetical protein
MPQNQQTRKVIVILETWEVNKLIYILMWKSRTTVHIMENKTAERTIIGLVLYILIYIA